MITAVRFIVQYFTNYKIRRIIMFYRSKIFGSICLMIFIGLLMTGCSSDLPTCLPDCSNADLSQLTLADADLAGANFSGANLSKASLAGVNLSKANLSNANLSEATLIGVDLSEADLTQADLSAASLSGVTLSKANLTGAKLGEDTLGNSVDLTGTIMPDGTTHE